MLFLKKKKQLQTKNELEVTITSDNEVKSGEDTKEAEQKEDMHDTLNTIFSEMITEYTLTRQQSLIEVRRGVITKEKFLQSVKCNFLQVYHSQVEEHFQDLMNQFEEFLFGYYVLTPLVEDPEISDIAVVAFDNIQVKKKGVNFRSDIKFETANNFAAFVEYVASKNQVDISNLNSIQIFTDRVNCKDYILRFVIVMPLLTSSGTPYLCIRKVAKNFPELDDLIRDGMLTNKQKEYVIERFQSHSLLVSGPSASGKTTFINALKEEIPHNKSCLIIQEAEEMSVKNHPYMMLEHPINNRGEGRVKYTLFDIVAAGLLMNMSYFIIGEIKGAEAVYLLNAAYTGHICATTIHAENAKTALDKLADYAKYGSDYKKAELMKMLTAFKTVVHIENYKIKEIYEVVDWNEEENTPVYKSITFSEE